MVDPETFHKTQPIDIECNVSTHDLIDHLTKSPPNSKALPKNIPLEPSNMASQ